MIDIICVVLLLMYIFFPSFRCVINHPFLTVYYMIKDIYKYFRYCRWREYKHYGYLTIFNGLFGKGKTLSSVFYARRVYQKYNGKKVYDFKEKKWKIQYIHIVSNVHITDIPYIQLQSLYDILEIVKNNDGVSVWLICVDEMSTQVNSREYKTNFTTDLLNVLLTCRHYRLEIIGSSQRFNHVDALVRQVTSSAIECNKFWRILRWDIYNAWTIENTSDITKVKPLKTKTIFIQDKDFESYDTTACVENFKENVLSGKHLTDMEILEFQNQQAEQYNELQLKKRYRKKLHN